jgi:hypothetical protein
MAEVPPWEEPGAVRRDCEPHRTPWLYLLAWLTLLAAILSLMCPLFVLVALPLLFGLRAAARRDLRLMDAGRMDPAGRQVAEGICGAAYFLLVLPGLGLIIWGGFFLSLLFKR